VSAETIAIAFVAVFVACVVGLVAMAIASDCCSGEYGHAPNCKRRRP
jgi:hypothetical protein